jgi:CRAL/TRIO domain
MPCALCLVDPLTHSFDPIGTIVRNGISHHVFYTSYRTIKDYSNSKAISEHITGYLDDISGAPWIWMMDCKFVQSKHMMQLGVAMKLLKMLRESYGARLMNLYLINSGPIINTALTAFSPFLSKEFKESIHRVPGTALELLTTLTGKYGWTMAEAEPFIKRIRVEYT